MSPDWAMVWITVVYVMATCAICWANIRSANATKAQLAETKRQFDEENRALVTATFEIIRNGITALCIENHGKQVAYNVEIRIVPEFINNIRDDTDKKLIKELCRASFTLGIGRKWYACLGSHLELEQLSQVPLAIDISYSDNQGRHKETTTIDLKQYFWSLIYDSPMVDANVELKKMAKSLQSIDRKTPKG